MRPASAVQSEREVSSRGLLPFFAATTAAKSAIWALTDLLLGALLHRFTDLDGPTIAVILCTLLLIGAGADLLIGYLLARGGMMLKSVAAMQLAGAVATSALLLMQFIVPIDRPLCLVGVAVSFRIAYAAFDVPLTTLTSLLPCGVAERERYVRVRMAAGAFSRLLVTGLNAYLFLWSAESLATFGIAGLGMLCLAMILCAAALRLKVKGMMPAMKDMPRCGVRHIKERWSFASLVPLLVGFLVAVAIVPTLSRLLVFVDADGQTPKGALLLCAFSIGSVIGPFALIPIRRLPKNYDPMSVAAVAACLSSLALGAAIVNGELTAMVVAALLHGSALGMVGTLLWNRAASLAASGSKRRDSMVFGAVTACSQVSVAMGTLALGPFIDAIAQADGSLVLTASAISCVGALMLTRLDQSKKTLCSAMAAAPIAVASPSTSEATIDGKGKGRPLRVGVCGSDN